MSLPKACTLVTLNYTDQWEAWGSKAKSKHNWKIIQHGLYFHKISVPTVICVGCFYPSLASSGLSPSLGDISLKHFLKLQSSTVNTFTCLAGSPPIAHRTKYKVLHWCPGPQPTNNRPLQTTPASHQATFLFLFMTKILFDQTTQALLNFSQLCLEVELCSSLHCLIPEASR